MRYRLRTLMIILTLGPPVLAAAWLWCRPFIFGALLWLECECIALVLLISVLAAFKLVWELAKGAVRLTRAAAGNLAATLQRPATPDRL